MHFHIKQPASLHIIIWDYWLWKFYYRVGKGQIIGHIFPKDQSVLFMVNQSKKWVLPQIAMIKSSKNGYLIKKMIKVNPPKFHFTETLHHTAILNFCANSTKRKNMIKKKNQLNRNEKFVDKARQCFCLFTHQAKIQICCTVKLIPWNLVNLSHL